MSIKIVSDGQRWRVLANGQPLACAGVSVVAPAGAAPEAFLHIEHVELDMQVDVHRQGAPAFEVEDLPVERADLESLLGPALKWVKLDG